MRHDFSTYNISSVFRIAVQNYRILWTGLGAQLARDVPFSAICWSTLEPVRICFLKTVGLFTYNVYSEFNYYYFLKFWTDQKKAS